MIKYPKEIKNNNQKAWYLRHFLGFTYEEIGKELNYTAQGIQQKYFPVPRRFQRQSIAVIYRKQKEFCKDECKKSASECRDCMLYKFMVSKMLKKSM